MLCVIRCPINAIFLSNGVACKREYAQLEGYEQYVREVEVNLEEKLTLTEKALSLLSELCAPPLYNQDVKDILDNFEAKTSVTQLGWAQDQYYVWVRNCLRELGLDALYTGSAGKLKRADVTLRAPFYAGIEVKSPAEGEINVGAIRQALDAAREVRDAYGADIAYRAVIGSGIARGAHRRAISWYNNDGVKIPLIRGRYLLYLTLKHQSHLPQLPQVDMRRILTEYVGWFGKDELQQYFKAYFGTRRNEITSGTVTLPLPPVVTDYLAAGNSHDALKELERLENETAGEIERCFPDPERKARGGYATD